MLAMHIALQYLGPDKARIIISNTIDYLRAVGSDMLSGVPILLDECEPGNHAALVHSDTSIWKSFLQVKDVATIRGRCQDIVIAQNQCKLITSNAATI